MFISAFILASLTFSLPVNNQTYAVNNTAVQSSNSVLYPMSQDITITAPTYSFTDDEEWSFYITYDNESYKLCTIHTLEYSTYYDFQITFYFQSNLQYQLILRPADGDRDSSIFSMPVYIDEYDEPYTMYKYYGDSASSYRFNATYDSELYGSGLDLSQGFNLGFLIHALDESTYNNLVPSYSENYNNGYNDGYQDGKQDGLTEGYNNGYEQGQSDGYDSGYQDGYTEADNQDAVATSIFVGIINIALVPINFFLACLNFEVFGINISSFVTALMTVMIVIVICRVIFNGGNKK